MVDFKLSSGDHVVEFSAEEADVLGTWPSFESSDDGMLVFLEKYLRPAMSAIGDALYPQMHAEIMRKLRECVKDAVKSAASD